MKAYEALIKESVMLPKEVRDKEIKGIQISFLFADGKMHHVKPGCQTSQKLAEDVRKTQRIRYENWSWLDNGEVEI